MFASSHGTHPYTLQCTRDNLSLQLGSKQTSFVFHDTEVDRILSNVHGPFCFLLSSALKVPQLNEVDLRRWS